jgi:hypothetical protein
MVFTFATMQIRDFVAGSRKVTGKYGTDDAKEHANLGLLFGKVSMSGAPQNDVVTEQLTWILPSCTLLSSAGKVDSRDIV